MRYSVRYVHKISSSDSDTSPDVELNELDCNVMASKFGLGRALRSLRILQKGEPIREYRIEASGRICVFPGNYAGITTGWHCIVLTPVR